MSSSALYKRKGQSALLTTLRLLSITVAFRRTAIEDKDQNEGQHVAESESDSAHRREFPSSTKGSVRQPSVE